MPTFIIATNSRLHGEAESNKSKTMSKNSDTANMDAVDLLTNQSKGIKIF